MTQHEAALVNEADLRLSDVEGLAIRDRARFFAMAATMMRRMLVDHACGRATDKRGGGATRITLDERIAEGKPDLALRFFTGLTIEETADTLSISPTTVKRDWAIAQAGLYDALKR